MDEIDVGHILSFEICVKPNEDANKNFTLEFDPLTGSFLSPTSQKRSTMDNLSF